jgi:glutamyl/glutaminyl-tRNA synthetase
MNTCFVPTPYRDPHIGHAWVAWNNWYHAVRSGGKFVCIFDDDVYHLQNLDFQGYSVEASVAEWVRQLTWLGCVPDEVVISSDNHEAHEAALAQLGLKMPTAMFGESWIGHMIRHPATGAQEDYYHPAIVALHVVDDALASVDAFWGGWEFIGERELYDHFTRALGYRAIYQTYLPEVRREKQPTKESKSLGAPTLFDLRDIGYSPQEIIDTLRECDRRSRAAGLRDTVIPHGYLSPTRKRVLKYQGHMETIEGAVKEARGKPWEAYVRASCAERKRSYAT